MGKTVIVSLKIVMRFGKISTVVFINNLWWDVENDQNIKIVCPPYAWPKSSVAGMTDGGVSSLQLSCGFSPSSYYIGDNCISVTMTKPTNTKFGHHCTTQNMSSAPYNSLYTWCELNVEVKSYSCPYGANCSAGITGLANYWGSLMQDGQIHMQ